MKILTVIVPCYNEEKAIPYFYEEIGKTKETFKSDFPEVEFELLFVDDGSSDGTLEVVKELRKNDETVHYVSFSRNFGKEAGIYAGLQHSHGDYVVIMDADLQHSPDILPVMLKEVHVEGYDVCAARREDREGEAKLKSGLSNAFYKVINRGSETKVNDSAQDFRIMKQKVVQSIIAMPESIRFSKGIFSWVGFNVKWIAHENRERAAGDTKWSLRKLAKYAVDGILGFTTSPLRAGFFFACIFVLVALAAFITGLVKCGTVEGYQPVIPFILAAMFVIGAVILTVIGIAGEYIGRVYTEVKGRPKYIVSQSNIREF